MKLVLSTAIVLILGSAAAAWAACSTTTADTCTAGILTDTVTAQCDIICGTGGTCGGGTFSNCDQCGSGAGGGSPDGYCTICNGDTANTIDGTSGADVICSGSGADTIDGKGGVDYILAGAGADTINGGSGDDVINGGDGADLIEGDNGDDFISLGNDGAVAEGEAGDDVIWGGTGDDVIWGGNDDDELVSSGGYDHIYGGAGNDILRKVQLLATSVDDDVVGTRYCGGSGNDTINAKGPAHLCVDGGDGTDTCDYEYLVTARSATDLDVGTATNCETATDFDGRSLDCDCP